MGQDFFVGRYYVERRFLRECSIFHVLATDKSIGSGFNYRCEALEYSHDTSVTIEYKFIGREQVLLCHEITEEQYQRGINLFYKSLMQIRQFVTSLKGIPCDRIQASRAFRLFGQLYFSVHHNPLESHTNCQNLEITPSSIILRRPWIPSSLLGVNHIDYEEIDPFEAQKAIKQFELFYATISNYINALAKE